MVGGEERITLLRSFQLFEENRGVDRRGYQDESRSGARQRTGQSDRCR